DGNARLNLATFVTTWMEPQAGVLMSECRARACSAELRVPGSRDPGTLPVCEAVPHGRRT
ncbi:hypothetical protein ACWDQL_27670, partial [Streptomyces olivaceus]